jgi:4-hydroxy-tetrahydrodipicolinate synthase
MLAPDGIFTALVTPFQSDGALDLAALRKSVAFQIEHGVRGVVPLGGTGEPLSLTVDEHRAVIDTVIDEAGDRLQVIAGALLPRTPDIVEVGRHARRAGAAALMVIPPYFVMATAPHVERHVAEIAERVDMPLVLYHGPQRSGIRLALDALLELAEAVPHLVAVKDTTGDAVFLANLVRQAPPRLALLQGWDELVYPTLALGGRGAIISLGCLVPRLFVELHAAFQEGRIARARELQLGVLALCQVIYSEPNPVPLKKALELVGRPAGPARPPLYPASDTTVTALRRVLRDVAV